jgi:amino acid transporter
LSRLFSFVGMIAWGLGYFALNPGAVAIPAAAGPKHAEGYALQPLSLLLLLGAFANGCTALTGVEAISNGVPAFRQPESRNAATTLLWMALLLTVMFLGTSVLAYLYKVEPRQEETVISQFARTIFADPRMRWAYYLVQTSTPHGQRPLHAAAVHKRGRPAGLLQRHSPAGLLLRVVVVKALEGLFIDRMDSNEDIFAKYMNDPAFKNVVSEHLLKQVYEQIRQEAG